MFGYVKAYEPDLKVKEQALYRAFYCGLCRSMGKCTGICSRCTLSYDITFLAIVRSILTNEVIEIKKARCFIHPFTKRPTVKPCHTLKFCSYASVLLTYNKLCDDVNDESGRKKLIASLARGAMRPAYKRSLKHYSALSDEISQSLFALTSLEKTNNGSLDEASVLSGNMLACIFSYGLEGTQKHISEAIGKNLGKWLYIIDAVDDYSDDIQRGRYNPLAVDDANDKLPYETLVNLKIILLNILADAEAAFDLIDYPDSETGRMLRGIVDNVLHIGLVKKIDEVLGKHSADNAIRIPDPDA
ncbi:MAG: hypothetical protein IKA82_01460 [Clostridia bacterium]|nr:hypothetical protein [Clostridia bacterium]